jgi:hypothetical protein
MIEVFYPDGAPIMESELLQKLGSKSITKEALFQMVMQNFNLLPEVLNGVSSSKATIRYGCTKVHPEKLYPYMGFFIALLDSRYRILTWNAMAILANLAKVDVDKTFDVVFNKYYSYLNDAYMVTVANVVGNSAKIALAKPYLIQKITNELLKVENISTTPHLTEECKRVIAEQAIKSFAVFFDKIEQKEKVVSFASSYLNSPRKTLKKAAEEFVTKFS